MRCVGTDGNRVVFICSVKREMSSRRRCFYSACTLRTVFHSQAIPKSRCHGESEWTTVAAAAAASAATLDGVRLPSTRLFVCASVRPSFDPCMEGSFMRESDPQGDFISSHHETTI